MYLCVVDVMSLVMSKVESARGRASLAASEVVQETVSEMGKSFLSSPVRLLEELLEVEEAAEGEAEEVPVALEAWVELALWVLDASVEDSTLELATWVLLLMEAWVVVETAMLVATEETAAVEVDRTSEVVGRVLHVFLRWWILRWLWMGTAETETSEKARMATRVLKAYMASVSWKKSEGLEGDPVNKDSGE